MMSDFIKSTTSHQSKRNEKKIQKLKTKLPNCPYLSEPQVNTCPHSLRAIEWFSPQAAYFTLYALRPLTKSVMRHKFFFFTKIKKLSKEY